MRKETPEERIVKTTGEITLGLIAVVGIHIGGTLITLAWGVVMYGAYRLLNVRLHIPFWALAVGLFPACWLLGVIFRAIGLKDATNGVVHGEKPHIPENAFWRWVIYERPQDYPQQRFVVRAQHIDDRGHIHFRPPTFADTLDEARARVQKHCTLCFPRNGFDDLSIVEVWEE